MPQVTLLWSLWPRLPQPFAGAFTRPGHRRFVAWVTALALNVEEHTVTQSVIAIERVADWRALERFVAYGRWDAVAVTRNLARLVETAPGRIWHGYHVTAVDDTKVHRSGAHVWGTCTFHESTARCPNRAAKAARRGNWQASLHGQDIAVQVDGVTVATFTPSGTDDATYTTPAFNVATGSHTIRFVGLDSAGGDTTPPSLTPCRWSPPERPT